MLSTEKKEPEVRNDLVSVVKKRRRVGIMGGTFDPIHTGHLILGETARQQLKLDKVLFMPSGNPPHKQVRTGQATNEQRVEMVRLAIRSNPDFELSLTEMEREGLTYSYQTMEYLKAVHPDTDYYFIIGADSAYDFDGWMKPERIAAACSIVAGTRDYVSREKLASRLKELSFRYHSEFLLLENPNIDISSHQLRSWQKEGRSLRYYVPDEVFSYIKRQHLYEEPEHGNI